MAFHDQNGRITIDENAANTDIKRMREARDRLQASLAAIESLRRDTGSMEGEAATAILEKSEEMRKKLQAMIDKIDAYVDFINRVVRRYQQIDADLKKAIEAARIAAESAASSKPSNASIIAGGVAKATENIGKKATDVVNNIFKPFG